MAQAAALYFKSKKKPSFVEDTKVTFLRNVKQCRSVVSEKVKIWETDDERNSNRSRDLSGQSTTHAYISKLFLQLCEGFVVVVIVW